MISIRERWYYTYQYLPGEVKGRKKERKREGGREKQSIIPHIASKFESYGFLGPKARQDIASWHEDLDIEP